MKKMKGKIKIFETGLARQAVKYPARVHKKSRSLSTTAFTNNTYVHFFTG